MREIRNIQQLWDSAITYRKNDACDTDAISEIYPLMDAKLSANDLTNVMSAVYADTYWKNNKMNSVLLAKSMVKSIGMRIDLAESYAHNAMKQWRGILLRKNLSDIGMIPAQGTYTSSLDIICNQDAELDSTDLLINNWNNEYIKKPQIGKNYIYIRCQNLHFKGEITPKVQLFYSQGGFNAKPSTWIQLLTKKNHTTGDVNLLGGKPGAMEEGVRGASEAFVFHTNTTEQVYLFAAINDTTFFTQNNPLYYKGNFNMAQWITHNGACAWHNVNLQSSTETFLKYCNQDRHSENFTFEAHCKNVPKGSIVTLMHNDDKLCKYNSDNIKISNHYQLVSSNVTLPPDYEGELIVSVKTPDGKLLPENASVEVQMIWHIKEKNRNFSKAIQMFTVYKSAKGEKMAKAYLGSFTILGISER